MELWTGKILFVLVLYVLAIATADINDVKRNAIKKLDSNVAYIKELADKTSIEVDKRQENVKIISKHEGALGEKIYEEIIVEISYTAKSVYMLAQLLNSPVDVFKCIEKHELDGKKDTETYYSQKFLTQGRNYESQALELQRNTIKAWKDDYYKAIEQYGNIYKKSVNDIKSASSESQISSTVRYFEQTTKQMSDIIVVIHPNMAKIHIQVLRLLHRLVSDLQAFARHRVDETTKAYDKCFPKFFQNEAFFNPILL